MRENRRITAWLFVVLVGTTGSLLAPVQAADVSATGLPAGWAIRHFSIADGLAHNQVDDILQDQNGFIWIATADGLQRFDARSFTTWHVPVLDPQSRPDPAVYRIAETPDGTIWAGTRQHLFKLGQDRQQLSVVSSGLNVQRLRVDLDGMLWVATMHHGLLQFADNTLVNAYPDFEDDFVRDFFWDSDGVLWLVIREGSAHSLVQIQKDGTVLTQKTVSKRELPLLDGTGTLQQMPELPSTNGSGSVMQVNDYVQTDTGEYWSAGLEGIYRWNGTGPVESVGVQVQGRWDHLSNEFLTITRDDHGNLWAGSYSGLFLFNPHALPIRSVVRKANGERLAEAVSSMVLDGAGRVTWLGTFGGGVLGLDPATETVERRVSFKSIGGHDSCDFIWSVKRLPNGLIAAGTACGVFAITADTGAVVHHYAQQDIRVLLVQDESLLVSGSSVPPVRLDFSLQTLSTLDGHATEALAPDADALWGATPVGFVTNDAKVSRWNAQGELQFSVDLPAGAVVYDLLLDHGRLWAATPLGLFHIDAARRIAKPISLQAGGNTIFSISPDAETDVLWLGTNRGLVRFDTVSGDQQVFLEDQEFNRRARARSVNGRLVLGGMQGVFAFHPGQIRENAKPPPVAITAVEVYGPDGVRMVRPGQWHPLTLFPGENGFLIRYAVLNFTQPSANRYRHRLHPFTPAHIDTELPMVRYAGLSPGLYTLKLDGANNSEVWNPQGVTLDIIVQAHFTQTLTFRLLVLALIAALLWGVWDYRRRRKQELERVRVRIATDLHDELGSDLSGLALSTSMVSRKSYLEPGEKQRLKEASETARHVLDGLRDIVWYIAPEHDRSDSLVMRMKSIANQMLADVDVVFEENLSGKRPLSASMRVRRDLLLIYKEALHNIARHAAAEHVKIAVTRSAHRLTLHIRDDGQGFDSATAQDGVGMASMQRRAENIGAVLTVQSRLGAGTELRCVVPV